MYKLSYYRFGELQVSFTSSPSACTLLTLTLKRQNGLRLAAVVTCANETWLDCEEFETTSDNWENGCQNRCGSALGLMITLSGP